MNTPRNANCYAFFTAVVVTFFATMVPMQLRAELLFQDTFASGDLSKHNSFFRWGTGAIREPGSGANSIVSVKGPDGQPANAIRFRYRGIVEESATGDSAHWSEQRFTLTKSISEKRSWSVDSNVAYPELWIRYDMLVPANYYHRLNPETGGPAPFNNKGFFFLTKNPGTGPSSGASIHNRVEWWPLGGADAGLSTMSLGNWSGHIMNPSYVHPSFRVQSSSSARPYTFLASDRGKWVDFAFRVRAASAGNANDGLFEFYRDGLLVAAWYNLNNWPQDDDPSKAGYDRGYVMGYHNSAYELTTQYFITNFRIGTSAAGVGVDIEGSAKTLQPPLLRLGP
jgi:hypothetical protein